VGAADRHLLRDRRQPDEGARPLHPRSDRARFLHRFVRGRYPRTLEALDRFGVPPRIASFVLPLGYSFNLDGSMMYMTFATIFVAQAYGIDLSLGTQVLMLLTLMITSKGVAACRGRAWW
jgi:L-cystine uptake protein TcyP (sodium:dicarboxylate symporter family)